jgi:hypothetical protein
MRYNFYQAIACLEDETAQKKGVSVVVHARGQAFMAKWPPASEVFEFFMKSPDISRSLPFRVTSYHYCYDDHMTKFLLKAIRVGMGKNIRIRIRTHFGKLCQCMIRSHRLTNDTNYFIKTWFLEMPCLRKKVPPPN